MPRGKEGKFVASCRKRPCFPLLSLSEMSYSHRHICGQLSFV